MYVLTYVMEVATMSIGTSVANANGSGDAGEIQPQSKNKPKRRNERNILTFYEKIAVIRYYDETNVSRNSLAKMFHCCATQIRRILERKYELLQQLATLSEADASIIIEEMTRKRRKFEMSAISFILHQWVERCRHMRLRKTITNDTLRETAIKMAAILNLPAFRPSYRWLNRFRGKYKYNDEDLGAGSGVDTITGELSVEDIIIEYKDSLPSFMQKEISAITSSAKEVEPLMSGHMNKESIAYERHCDNDDHSRQDFDISDDEDDEIIENSEKIMVSEPPVHNNNDIENLTPYANDLSSPENSNHSICSAPDLLKKPESDMSEYPMMNAGSAALLQTIFPHLAVIHQFALLNADVKALELISQLGVHMQTQAAEGGYKQLSLATSSAGGIDSIVIDDSGENIYPDIDDIVLIE